ncbi:MAG: adenylate/guanylate cyclase domain-containing protein [Elusimicrobiota bacterium]
MKKVIIPILLVIVLIIGNHIFNLIESKNTKPTSFNFSFPDGKLHKSIADRYKIPADTKIKDIELVGTFNEWGCPKHIDYILNSAGLYFLKKVDENSYTTTLKLTLKLPPGIHLYKFRLIPKDKKLREKIQHIWTEDLNNFNKVDDHFGGFNSVVEIKTVKPVKLIFNLVMLTLLFLVLVAPFFNWFIRILMRLNIRLLPKFIIIAGSVLLLFGIVLSSALILNLKNIFRDTDIQIANLLYVNSDEHLNTLLRDKKTEPPTQTNTFWKVVARFRDTKGISSFVALRKIDITNVVVYSSDGIPLTLGAAENTTLWLNAHPESFKLLIKNLYTKIDFSNIHDLTYARVEPTYYTLKLYPKKNIFSDFLLTLKLIIQTKQLFPYNAFIYPIRTITKVHGYFLIFSYYNLKQWQLANILSSSGYSLLLISIIGIMVLIFVIQVLLMPVYTLVKEMRRVENMDFNARVYFKTKDEIGQLGSAFNEMVKGLKEREFVKETFKRYVAKPVVEKILKNPGMLHLKGERRNISVLFVDIRGFTKYAEASQPEEVLETLNQYFDKIIDVIFEYEGTLDKFIGDCVMAVFGVPLEQQDHYLRACKCALKIRDEIIKLNQIRTLQNKQILHTGIAINTGEAVAGNIGSEKRTDYSVIGDTVNVAFRLQQICYPGQVLIGENVYQYVKAEVAVPEPFETEIKGRIKPVKVYELLNVNDV